MYLQISFLVGLDLFQLPTQDLETGQRVFHRTLVTSGQMAVVGLSLQTPPLTLSCSIPNPPSLPLPLTHTHPGSLEL